MNDEEIEKLVRKLVELTGESRTEAIRRSLEERVRRLEYRRKSKSRYLRLRRLMEQEIWPRIPEEVLGKTITKTDEEDILGFGPEGV